jgi:hypothetical protein
MAINASLRFAQMDLLAQTGGRAARLLVYLTPEGEHLPLTVAQARERSRVGVFLETRPNFLLQSQWTKLRDFTQLCGSRRETLMECVRKYWPSLGPLRNNASNMEMHSLIVA